MEYGRLLALFPFETRRFRVLTIRRFYTEQEIGKRVGIPSSARHTLEIVHSLVDELTALGAVLSPD